jgi:type IV secretory pathway TraG/TraD family ATPase VirD4
MIMAPSDPFNLSSYNLPIDLTTVVSVGFVVGIIILLFWTLRRSSPVRTTTGGLAGLREQARSFHTRFGRGGYLLGYTIDSPYSGINILSKLFQRGPKVLRLSPADRLTHILIQSGTGSGKTTGYVIPQLIEDAVSGQFNLFVVDRKSPELMMMLSAEWEKRGHKVLFLAPWSPELSVGFEPLFGADADDITAMVETIIGVNLDPNSTLTYYRENERKILHEILRVAQRWGKCQGQTAGLNCNCAHTKDEHQSGEIAENCQCPCRRHYCTLPAIAKLINLGYRRVKAAIEEVAPEVNRMELADLWLLRENELAGTFGGLANKLRLFSDPAAAAVFSRKDFTLDDLVPGADIGCKDAPSRTLLIIGAPQSHGASSDLLASLMTRLVINKLFHRRDQMASVGKRWQDVVPLIMVLDELGTYRVQTLESFLATARSGGAGVLAAIQNPRQLEAFYDAAAVEALMTNFVTHIYLRGAHHQVAKELSEMIGTALVLERSSSVMYAGSRFGGKNLRFDKRYGEQPVKTIDDIIYMPTDRALIMSRLERPFEVRQAPFFKDPWMAGVISESEKSVGERLRHNRQADLLKQSRPIGEPRRLTAYDVNWILLLAVKAAMESEAKHQRKQDGSGPMTSTQRNAILAILRRIGRYTGQREESRADFYAAQVTNPQKLFKALTVSEANLLLRFIESMESRYTQELKLKRVG